MQSGNVYRDRKSGAWYVCFRNEAKKRVHVRLVVNRDCDCPFDGPCSECRKSARFAASKVAESRVGVPSSADANCTLAEFWLIYKHDKEVELNPSTLVNYTAIWRHHVDPALGKKRLTASNALNSSSVYGMTFFSFAITKQNCSELLRKIARENPELSRKTLQRIKAFMTALFNHAAEKWEMPPNPASGKLGKIGTTTERLVARMSIRRARAVSRR